MTADFGASDGTTTDQLKTQAKGGAIVHIPIVAAAEAAVYNLRGIARGAIKTTPDTSPTSISKWLLRHAGSKKVINNNGKARQNRTLDGSWAAKPT
jgi:hypothetical protein